MKNVPEPVRWLDAQSDAPEEVRKLLAVGQDAFGPRAGQLEPLGSFVAGLGAASVGAGAGAGAGTGVSGGIHAAAHSVGKSALLKLATLVVLGGGAAGGAWTVVHGRTVDPRAVAVTDVASSPSPAANAGRVAVDESPPVEPSALPEAAPSAPPVPEAPLPPHSTAPAARPSHPSIVAPVLDPTPSAPASPPATELDLLKRAHRALAASPSDALRALDEHAIRFPHGVFEQEREVLAIEALMKAGRVAEARARATSFRTAFPHSALDRRVGVLVGEQ